MGGRNRKTPKAWFDPFVVETNPERCSMSINARIQDREQVRRAAASEGLNMSAFVRAVLVDAGVIDPSALELE